MDKLFGLYSIVSPFDELVVAVIILLGFHTG